MKTFFKDPLKEVEKLRAARETTGELYTHSAYYSPLYFGCRGIYTLKYPIFNKLMVYLDVLCEKSGIDTYMIF